MGVNKRELCNYRVFRIWTISTVEMDYLDCQEFRNHFWPFIHHVTDKLACTLLYISFTFIPLHCIYK